jgi:hypothetical protein
MPPPLGSAFLKFLRFVCYIEMQMSETLFTNAIFDLVEFLTRDVITNTSKRLLMTYIKEAQEGSPAAQARSAIKRYIQKELPTLQEIREKSKTEELSKLDHLVLKMEYEATRIH